MAKIYSFLLCYCCWDCCCLLFVGIQNKKKTKREQKPNQKFPFNWTFILRARISCSFDTFFFNCVLFCCVFGFGFGLLLTLVHWKLFLQRDIFVCLFGIVNFPSLFLLPFQLFTLAMPFFYCWIFGLYRMNFYPLTDVYLRTVMIVLENKGKNLRVKYPVALLVTEIINDWNLCHEICQRI